MAVYAMINTCCRSSLHFQKSIVITSSRGFKRSTSEKKERPSTESLIQWKKLPVPKTKPDDLWNEEHALFGENDYKDILGDTSYDLRKNIKIGPWWLKGWRGNELQMLIRKKRYVGADMGPVAKHDMNKRIGYLYKKFNRNKGNWMYYGDD